MLLVFKNYLHYKLINSIFYIELFHNFIVSSFEADAIKLPVGEKLTSRMGPYKFILIIKNNLMPHKSISFHFLLKSPNIKNGIGRT